MAYMNDVVEQAGLAPHIQFHHNFMRARWDPSRSGYTLEIEDTTTGQIHTSNCHVLICATGNFHVPDMSCMPGIEGFAGELMHTSQWDPEVDLRNKKVAVIGNGASG
jgi:cation diffusion facilitator CzcD-associated flavoprotein CzcO